MSYADKLLAHLSDDVVSRYRFVVIMGMAKAGTSLPLALLDSHPELLVFPEELRFFHSGCDRPDGAVAANVFLSNSNVRMLSVHDAYFDDYKDHSGTGFGSRDYSNVDFDVFADLVLEVFASRARFVHRYAGILLAYEFAKRRETQFNPEKEHIFVTKAPHNELYLRLWRRMLGDQAKYIVVVRDPLELSLSLCNIDEMYGTSRSRYDPVAFARQYRGRMHLWEQLPAEELFVAKYENLTRHPEAEMQRLSAFLGITFEEILLQPTKNGVPWAGNSSRGIVEEGIFRNPKRARKELDEKVVRFLQARLSDLMDRFGYETDKNIRPHGWRRRRWDSLLFRLRHERRLLRRWASYRFPWLRRMKSLLFTFLRPVRSLYVKLTKRAI